MDPGNSEQDQEEKRDLPKDVLALLLALECRARRGAVAQERRERLRERRELRESLLRELRLRRDRIRESIGLACSGKSGTRDPREIVEWKIRNCRERLRLFQLTGVSGHVSSQGLCLSFHPACQGSSLAPFRLELRQFPAREPGRGPEFRLGRHSIPPFIPLERLRRQFLPREPREFLGTLFQHLNAFAGRRHQLHMAQAEFGEFIQGVPARNSLCNLLSFRYRIPGGIPGKDPEKVQEFQARLLYGDPLRSLPTEVEVTAQGGAAAPSEHRELFQRLPLPRALRGLAGKTG